MVFAVEIITLVPSVWQHVLGSKSGLIGRAFNEGTAELTLNDLRDFGKGIHRQVDDTPFGGGAGMVLAVEPLHKAITVARQRNGGPIYLLDPRGKRFDQKIAHRIAQGPGVVLICGRYEGIDERVRKYVDDELSVGDFVLSAGDPAAWCVIDAVVRLLPGVLGNPASLHEESFSSGILEYPQYTRPNEYDGMSVPEVLRSGNHAAIVNWRDEQATKITHKLRPDLIQAQTTLKKT
ncbi:MAG: tRNA (guanosine(37)-N1)-methyltransferase TrmD [Deltaproteobacteria bacterium]|nr:tRNA (guanosine(37)-N1)-methyltransferase TrmD [Deltaproteobacteria bacterium]